MVFVYTIYAYATYSVPILYIHWSHKDIKSLFYWHIKLAMRGCFLWAPQPRLGGAVRQILAGTFARDRTCRVHTRKNRRRVIVYTKPQKNIAGGAKKISCIYKA
jgi:hypothetical protein